MVDILSSTLYAVRSGNWYLLLSCINGIIPFAFAYDNINYAWYLTAMLADMSTLSDDFPEIYQEFVAGNFATQLSKVGKFSRCETDKVIEMILNRDTKIPGGTTGFSTNTNAARRWEINASYRASLRSVFHQHLQYRSSKYDHKDLSPARILKDEKDISVVLTVLSEMFINPFSELPLVSISTGIHANEKIVHDSLNALEIEKDQMNKFVDERISISSTMSSFDAIKMNKLCTFKSMNKVTTCKTKNATISFTATADLFLTIAIISQKRSIDLKSLFSYPLGPLAMSLTEADRILLHKLEKDVEPLQNTQLIVFIL